jgi:hypothetical protein
MSGDVPAEGPPTAAGALPTAHMLGAGGPVRLGKRVALVNEDTGQYQMPQELQGANVETLRYKPSAVKSQGQAKTYFYSTDENGNARIIKTQPRVGGTDEYIKIDKKAPGKEGHALTPQERIDLFTLQEYQRAQKPDKNGNVNISDEMTKAAVDAAKRLSLPTYKTVLEENVPGIKGLFERLIPGGETGTTKRTQELPGTAPADQPPTEDPAYAQDLARAQQAVDRGLLSREEADRRLKGRYGRGL